MNLPREHKKSTHIEVENRVRQVFELLLKGFQRSGIVQYCSKNFGISSRQTDELMQRARAQIREINKEENSELAAKIILNYWKIFRKTQDKEDYHLAMQALERIGKLKGLDQITVNHNVNVKEFDNMPDDAIDAYFEKKKDE